MTTDGKQNQDDLTPTKENTRIYNEQKQQKINWKTIIITTLTALGGLAAIYGTTKTEVADYICTKQNYSITQELKEQKDKTEQLRKENTVLTKEKNELISKSSSIGQDEETEKIIMQYEKEKSHFAYEKNIIRHKQ